MNFGIVIFPGSNCDHDCYYSLKQIFQQEVEFIWHKSTSVDDFDCLILPGGFSYGDYLRCGAIARFSPVMPALVRFAQAGGLVLGICNGFQILLEVGLLPGAMLPNKTLKFICQDTYLQIENHHTPFTCLAEKGQVIKLPIAHGQGNYFISVAELRKLEERGQIVFRYSTRRGEITMEANPNGSLGNIAGICNPEGNVLGMMPHPERCAENILGNTDGRLLFNSIIEHAART
jgi:phosphoribosylformylglycinamidine synthase subunit PurQ / glutaminase